MSRKRDFIFASARVRSVEKYLLTHEQIEKLLNAAAPADALKILYDLEYGDGGGQVDPEHFEQLLTEEHNWVYGFISSIVPDPREFTMFRYPYDYHNLKAVLKAEFMETDPKPMLLEFGSVETDKLEAMVRERDFSFMTEIMKSAVTDAIDAFSRTGDPQRIDLILDKACFGDMLSAAGKTESGDFLLDYIRLTIDVTNIKTFARLRKMDKYRDFFSRAFIPGGTLSEKLFLESYEESLEQFSEWLLPYGFHAVVTQGGAMLRETGKFTLLEKLCDDKIIQFIRSARYVTFGIEPPAAYLIAKEYEIKAARIIMAGKLAGLPNAVIRERLRETYV
jgi:V/A-type H+-transporting ATPase subunit C